MWRRGRFGVHASSCFLGPGSLLRRCLSSVRPPSCPPLSTRTPYNGRLACPHAHASACFWRPGALPGERPRLGDSVGPRRALAFLVPARGVWLGWAVPAAGRVYATRVMFLEPRALLLPRRCGKIALAEPGDNPAAWASRTFSHWQSDLAKRAPESVTKVAQNGARNQSQSGRVANRISNKQNRPLENHLEGECSRGYFCLFPIPFFIYA
jgi:hypothetical protein